jgi:hypothetical protein
MLARMLVLAGAMVAGTAGATSAATHTYRFEGACVGDCTTGANFEGDMNIGDTSFSPGGSVSEDDFLSIAFHFATGQIIGNLQGGGPAQVEATWGDTAGQLGSFSYRASAALQPQFGFTVSANLTDGDGPGGLAGSMLASLAGNCNAAICDDPLLTAASVYTATGNPQVSPAPIPLPAPVLLLGAGLAALLGLRLRRREAAAA